MRLRVLVVTLTVSAFSASNPALERQFEQTVRPFVTKYCVGCHSGKAPAAALDLHTFASMDAVVREYPRWAAVHDRMAASEMPPKAAPQPPAADSRKVIAWIETLRADEIRNHAGDPGAVLARRLSNSEYNYTIRDLTGADLRPTREFPVDPANLAGFDNSGESLTMSPALLKKYLQAARSVGDHMVLTQDGIDFAPHPMLSETDRDKYPIQRIIRFYESQPIDFADYFQAAWRYKHRTTLGNPKTTLAAIAAESKISAKYLPTVWQLLEDPSQLVGPVAKLQAMWRALPNPEKPNPAKPNPTKQDTLRADCVAMRNFVVRIRSHTSMQFAAPVVRGLPAGSQPLLNWKLRSFALHHRDSNHAALRNDTDPPEVEPTIPRYPGLHSEAAPRWAALRAKARMGDADLTVPAAQRKAYEASFSRFASVFPDTFYVRERGRFFPDDSQDKGRLLSAGNHSVMGFYRDDAPLMDLILSDKDRKHLDRLWEEFEYIADFTGRTFVQYFFNQSGEVQGKGAESATARPVNNEVTDTPVIYSLRDAYLAKAAADSKNDPIAAEAIRGHFEGINSILRRLEVSRVEAQPKQQEALLQFAARAFRRPLSKAERDDILGYYRKMREKDALPHEEAMRDSIVSILMSPHFLYRLDLIEASSRTNAAARPLSGYALASRLSYFLWSSMPDAELLQHAAQGDLRRPEVLLAQTRRMLRDERMRDFATEFAGNWLGIRQFENFNSVDRERFPSFTNELRQAMFVEPIRFLQDLFTSNRSILDALYAKHTFVNSILAKHYGMPEVKTADWARVDDADRYQRGGLLPMAVFLTNSSPGLRTSPVKRGYWVVHRVLDETIPPPPAVVPELPSDEAKSDMPLREVLAQHRANPVCASCHARFDAFGLVFEGYGPIGETRAKDLAGRPIDASAAFPDHTQGTGLEGIQKYIREHRQKDFQDGLSRKMIAYALNRSLQLSDEALVEGIGVRLKTNQNRAHTLIETIVTSPQFLQMRTPVSLAKSDIK